MPTQISVKNPCQRLGAILLDEGMISEEQLREALAKRNQEGGFLGKVLVEMGHLQELALTSILVKQCKIPHISLMDYEIDAALIEMVTKEICDAYQLVPIDKMGSILTVAMVDPLDLAALVAVKEQCPNLRVRPILCSWNHFEKVMQKHYSREARQTEEVSLGSFGLSESTVGKAQPVKREEPAAVKKTPPAAPPEEVASASNEASEDAFRESLRDYVRAIVRRGVEGIADRVGAYITQSGGLPITGAKLVEAVQTAMDDTLEDALGGLLYQVQEALEQANAPAMELTAAQLSNMLRSNLRLAFEEASSGFLIRLEEIIPHK